MTKLLQIDGLPIVDAKRPMRLSITKPDIAKAAASTKDPRQCAAARACYRELHCKEVRVHLSRAYIRTNDANWVRYQVPLELRAEIIAFDRGGSFEPCEVILKPVNSATLTRLRSTKSTKTRTGKKRRKPHHITNVRSGPA